MPKQRPARLIDAIAGIYPTVWATISLASGITATAGAYTPACRHFLDEVQLCGTVNGTISTGTTLCTLPTGFWPAATVRIATANAGGGGVTLNISTAGVILAEPAAGVTAVTFDGLSFRLI